MTLKRSYVDYFSLAILVHNTQNHKTIQRHVTTNLLKIDCASKLSIELVIIHFHYAHFRRRNLHITIRLLIEKLNTMARSVKDLGESRLTHRLRTKVEIQIIIRFNLPNPTCLYYPEILFISDFDGRNDSDSCKIYIYIIIQYLRRISHLTILAQTLTQIYPQPRLSPSPYLQYQYR